MFLDTSGFYCLFNGDQRDHESAIKHYDSANRRITTNYVLAEYVALADARRSSRQDFLAFSERVLGDNEVEIVWVDEAIHRRAVTLLNEGSDKNYSLCDAVTFVVMRDLEITEALSTDKHFEQEGHIRLLRP